MITIVKCLLVLGFTYLLLVALAGAGVALGSTEVALLGLAALGAITVAARTDRRRHERGARGGTRRG